MINKPKHLRIGQTIFNFLEWIKRSRGFHAGEMGERCADPFNIPDEELIELYKQWLELDINNMPYNETDKRILPSN